MSSKPKAVEATIVGKATALLDAGYFTHCHIEVGTLSGAEPTFQWTLLPKEADVFDLASLTKALVTVPLIADLARSGVNLATQLGEIAPFALPPEIAALNVGATLRHTSGLPAWTNFWICRLNDTTSQPEMRRTAHDHILAVLGRRERWLLDPVDRYCDIGFIVLGALWERRTGMPLEEGFRRLRGPLEGSAWLDYSPNGAVLQRAVPTSYCAVRGRELKGEVHDENCAALGGVTGHSGLFGSAEGVRRFLQRFWASEAAKTWRSWSYAGWRAADDLSSSGFGGGTAVGHMGFTGTAFWLVPREDRYAMILTNRVISGRVSQKIRDFRGEVFTLLDSLR